MALLGLTAVAVVALLALGIFAVSQKEGATNVCGDCKMPLVGGVSQFDTYEILVCPGCLTPTTAVHGVPSELAYCPACLQRAMHVPCVSVESDRGVGWEVHEQCHLCGHEAVQEISTPNIGKDADVLPFRRPSSTPD